MAEPYLEQLRQVVDRLDLPQAGDVVLDPRHFFSGAALYANKKICATIGPAGFALKLPADTRRRLIEESKAVEFRFFADGPIKREYAALSESTIQDEETLRDLIGMSINYVLGFPGSNIRRICAGC